MKNYLFLLLSCIPFLGAAQQQPRFITPTESWSFFNPAAIHPWYVENADGDLQVRHFLVGGSYKQEFGAKEISNRNIVLMGESYLNTNANTFFKVGGLIYSDKVGLFSAVGGKFNGAGIISVGEQQYFSMGLNVGYENYARSLRPEDFKEKDDDVLNTKRLHLATIDGGIFYINQVLEKDKKRFYGGLSFSYGFQRSSNTANAKNLHGYGIIGGKFPLNASRNNFVYIHPNLWCAWVGLPWSSKVPLALDVRTDFIFLLQSFTGQVRDARSSFSIGAGYGVTTNIINIGTSFRFRPNEEGINMKFTLGFDIPTQNLAQRLLPYQFSGYFSIPKE